VACVWPPRRGRGDSRCRLPSTHLPTLPPPPPTSRPSPALFPFTSPCTLHTSPLCRRLNFAHSIYSTAETLYLITAGWLPRIWVFAGQLLAAVSERAGGRWPGWASGELSQTVVFMLVLFLGNTILELPWGVYSTFVVEQRHGFNKQTPGLYVSDLVKQVRARLRSICLVAFVECGTGPYDTVGQRVCVGEVEAQKSSMSVRRGVGGIILFAR
jgi:hypothetical protein